MSPFTILELQNPSHDVLQLHNIRRSPDFEALKLPNGSSGTCFFKDSKVADETGLEGHAPAHNIWSRPAITLFKAPN